MRTKVVSASVSEALRTSARLQVFERKISLAKGRIGNDPSLAIELKAYESIALTEEHVTKLSPLLSMSLHIELDASYQEAAQNDKNIQDLLRVMHHIGEADKIRAIFKEKMPKEAFERASAQGAQWVELVPAPSIPQFRSETLLGRLMPAEEDVL